MKPNIIKLHRNGATALSPSGICLLAAARRLSDLLKHVSEWKALSPCIAQKLDQIKGEENPKTTKMKGTIIIRA